MADEHARGSQVEGAKLFEFLFISVTSVATATTATIGEINFSPPTAASPTYCNYDFYFNSDRDA